jgi:type VI secretion system protein ImpF
VASKPTGIVTLPLLDRLTYKDPRRKEVALLSPAQSVAEFKAAVRRDLEWLLNTHRIFDKNLPPHVSRSVLYYGLPEVAATTEDRLRAFQDLARAIETSIAMYEPRLAGVKVSLSPHQEASSHHVDLIIEGLLQMDPAEEHVSYNTVLDLSSHRYQVKGEAGGG